MIAALTALRPFLPLALIIAVFAGGYAGGCSVAATEGRAALNALKAEHAEEKRRASDAYGKAVADALEKYRQEVERGDGLAARLAAREKTHATETAAWRRKIAHATKNRAAVVLGPDVVRLLNEAAGACLPDAPQSGAVYPPGPDGRPAAGPAPCTRLLEEFNFVSEADFTDWFIQFARRAQWLEGRYTAWRHLFSNRPAEPGQGK